MEETITNLTLKIAYVKCIKKVLYMLKGTMRISKSEKVISKSLPANAYRKT